MNLPGLSKFGHLILGGSQDKYHSTLNLIFWSKFESETRTSLKKVAQNQKMDFCDIVDHCPEIEVEVTAMCSLSICPLSFPRGISDSTN